MNDPPRLEVNDDEDVVAAEPEVADFDEVTGLDGGGLLTEESGPPQAFGRRGAGGGEVSLDDHLGDGDAELEEFRGQRRLHSLLGAALWSALLIQFPVLNPPPDSGIGGGAAPT